MKSIFDTVSFECSKNVTKSYSTSFSAAVKMLAPSIRQDIYNIYGFVRFADEIVDTFHDYNKEDLFDLFEKDLQTALQNKISLNPILNSFQHTVHKYQIPNSMINAFMKSMRLDLVKTEYKTFEEYNEYIYGSADVVGLMCLKVFVNGDDTKYNELEHSAMRLGSAFQKVNFLRDLKADFEDLSRTYFPNTDLSKLDEESKNKIIQEIEADFEAGYQGIVNLPLEAKFGVYTAYIYYKKLLSKLKKTPSAEIKNTRIRVSDYQKYGLFAKCYFTYKLNII
ncbi:phytoene/squalene synthase family protein [Flavobacterium aquatile]|uniref:Phytoene synthase n=1 Tax=Flavobacterium aquatile LMG 4008 = ATCC 11947 TaxID=1453498 RepID=A0A095U4X6_9FLAO|nr:phytoene/squalene synthase family protein [Flavobacterium aquatile]KGD69693.1 phytoene synthase [Flavobacterium aquatile LMG 4008 = ATCC 11947]OXA67172.1 phytoene synthase [Flavobacterium aquatile] [Flavobacterium aquatile LMG 4008 = ATCC 11947]GEC77825.1 phytoene synthase [Flavobacterium aquatile]